MCLTDVRSAIANYRKALSMMEDTPSARDLRQRLSQLLDSAGLVAFTGGNTAAALTLADEALVECYHPLIDLHKAAYLAASEAHGPAEAILRRILEESPEEVQPEASTLLARLLISTRRDFGGAKALIDEMAAQFPNDKSTMQAQQLFAVAFARFRQGAERSLCAAALGKAIDAFPDDAALYYSRALAHCEAEAYTAAVQDLFTCVNKSDGTHPEAAPLMGRVLAAIGDGLAAAADSAGAMHYFSESLKWCDPESATACDVLLARGDCAALLGRHDEALADYTLVRDRDPSHEGARSRLGQLHDAKGSALYNKGDYLVAEVEFTKAIECFDQNAAFFYHRALARGMLGKGAMMVRDLMSCRDLGTDSPPIVAMIQQFCSESTAAESRYAKEATEEEARLEAELRTARAISSANRRRDQREQRPAPNACAEQTQLRTLRGSGREALDGGVLTPANIRHFVRNMQVGKSAAVVVHTNAITAQRTINGQDARIVERDERQRPHWAVSQRKAQSRLDKVVVSKPTPPPRYFRFTPAELPSRPSEVLKQVINPPVGAASAARRAPLAPMNSAHQQGAGSGQQSEATEVVASDAYLTARKAPVATALPVLTQRNR